MSSVIDRARIIAEPSRVPGAANVLTEDALEFVAHTGAFYAREWAGNLSDDEKVELAAALVRLYRARLPEPEEIFDAGPPRGIREPREDRERPQRRHG